MYITLNIFFHTMHMAIILYSMFGWLYFEFITIYMIFQFLILFSWIGYGLYDRRWGFCIMTDLHWFIKEKYKSRPTTESYIYYWSKFKFKLNTKKKIIDRFTFGVYFFTLIIGMLVVL